MPQTFTIETSLDGVTWTALDNIVSINGEIGRKAFIDTFQPSRMNFTMRYPTGFASPNTDLISGTKVRLKRTGSLYTMWTGDIANVTVDYGIPYESGVGNDDFVSVNCEGAFAEWGRLDGQNEFISASNAYFALAQVSSASGLPIGTTYSDTLSPFVSDSNVSSSYADWINLFATTLGATIKDGSGQLGVNTKDFIGSLPVAFSDVANNATNQAYEKIDFTSQVENYFTKVIITPSLYPEQVSSVGSAPFRTLSLSTISGSAGQAKDLADYYLALYQTPLISINSITCRSEAQNTWALDLGYAWWDIIGYRTTVTFRGTSFYMSIIGASFQATPAGSTFTYYLAGADFLPFFILDDVNFGVLDQNKLSW